MKKLLITTALIFAASAAPAAAETVLTADVSFDGRHAFSCSWTGFPDGEDCRAIVGDAQDEIALLERHGARRADIVVDVSALGHGIIRRSVQKRSDGTYLSRGTSKAAPEGWGFVCGGAPLRCARWEGGNEDKTIAQATRKVTKKKQA